VQDGPLSLAAQRINERGFATREESVTRHRCFYLLPRLMRWAEVARARSGWRQKHLFNVA